MVARLMAVRVIQDSPCYMVGIDWLVQELSHFLRSRETTETDQLEDAIRIVGEFFIL